MIIGSKEGDVIHRAPGILRVQTEKLPHADGVNHGVRSFGFLENFTVGFLADGVEPRRHYKDGFLPVDLLQPSEDFINRIEKNDLVVCRKAQILESAEQLVFVLCEVGHDFRVQINFHKCSPVVFLETVDETNDRSEHVVEVVHKRFAELEHDDDRQGSVVGTEAGDRLLNAIIEDLEVILLKTSDQSTLIVRHDDVDVDEVHINRQRFSLDGVLGPLRRRRIVRAGFSSRTLSKEGRSRQDQHYYCKHHS